MTPLDRLLQAIADVPSAIVAYSGGVDSATVAAAAWRVLGDRMLAVVSASESVSSAEFDNARRVASEIGMPLRVIETREIEDPDYVRNDSDRCFYCKSTLYRDLASVSDEMGFAAIFNGTNVDDLGDHRPGLEAARRAGVRSPLLEAGLGKAEVRDIARELGISAWDRPATACLASRLPFGMAVTRERLRQVERAERLVAELGFAGHRVRHHGDIGRLEVPEGFIDRAISMRSHISECLHEAGFRFAALDLDGYRQGSLNPVSAAAGADPVAGLEPAHPLPTLG